MQDQYFKESDYPNKQIVIVTGQEPQSRNRERRKSTRMASFTRMVTLDNTVTV
jgi:hypothetical protein